MKIYNCISLIQIVIMKGVMVLMTVYVATMQLLTTSHPVCQLHCSVRT